MNETNRKREWIRIPIPKKMVQEISSLIFGKGYSSVAEYVRTAAREKLQREEEE